MLASHGNSAAALQRPASALSPNRPRHSNGPRRPATAQNQNLQRASENLQELARILAAAASSDDEEGISKFAWDDSLGADRARGTAEDPTCLAYSFREPAPEPAGCMASPLSAGPTTASGSRLSHESSSPLDDSRPGSGSAMEVTRPPRRPRTRDFADEADADNADNPCWGWVNDLGPQDRNSEAKGSKGSAAQSAGHGKLNGLGEARHSKGSKESGKSAEHWETRPCPDTWSWDGPPQGDAERQLHQALEKLRLREQEIAQLEEELGTATSELSRARTLLMHRDMEIAEMKGEQLGQDHRTMLSRRPLIQGLPESPRSNE
mmetsp:Transcript_3224/g.6539  ORF Transcript_3224/g.6539 Transcript_3224/m.6539 type:complete len:321 (-) Transcript_3224:83-1045(-)